MAEAVAYLSPVQPVLQRHLCGTETQWVDLLHRPVRRPGLPGQMEVTVTLKEMLCGTRCTSSRKAYRQWSRRRCVIRAGRSRWSSSR